MCRRSPNHRRMVSTFIRSSCYRCILSLPNCTVCRCSIQGPISHNLEDKPRPVTIPEGVSVVMRGPEKMVT